VLPQLFSWLTHRQHHAMFCRVSAVLLIGSCCRQWVDLVVDTNLSTGQPKCTSAAAVAAALESHLQRLPAVGELLAAHAIHSIC
jgi:hypothetical protein